MSNETRGLLVLIQILSLSPGLVLIKSGLLVRVKLGGRAALPMWIQFMKDALKGRPEKPLIQPSGLVTVRIDKKTGKLAGTQHPNAVFETFKSENVPKRFAEREKTIEDSDGKSVIPEPLF